MPGPNPERELRRAVGQLSQYAIEDIEAIWAELGPLEQAQLRPMLAQVSAALPKTAPTPDAAVAIEALAEADAAALAGYVSTLSETLGASVLASLDPAQRDAVLRTISMPQREILRASMAAVELKPAARQALRTAAWAASREWEPPQTPAIAQRRGLLRFLRRSGRP